MSDSPALIAMTFSGGLGLAAYHAGVYQAFTTQGLPLHWVTGSSAGAITAALIAGNGDENRFERLRAFWNFPPIEGGEPAPWPHLHGWIAAVGTRLVGSRGHFAPRFPAVDPFRFRSFYDLAPMRERLTKLVDFGRLNSGEMRTCVATTNIETGEPVIFDSSHVQLEIDHLMASCGFLPEFAPVEIDGRLLGDGGLSLNAPFDPILEAESERNLLLYVVDLYARDGQRPASLEAAAERKRDLLFGNQTLVRLRYLSEVRRLRKQLSPRRVCRERSGPDCRPELPSGSRRARAGKILCALGGSAGAALARGRAGYGVRHLDRAGRRYQYRTAAARN